MFPEQNRWKYFFKIFSCFRRFFQKFRSFLTNKNIFYKTTKTIKIMIFSSKSCRMILKRSQSMQLVSSPCPESLGIIRVQSGPFIYDVRSYMTRPRFLKISLEIRSYMTRASVFFKDGLSKISDSWFEASNVLDSFYKSSVKNEKILDEKLFCDNRILFFFALRAH